ncbi:MAG: alpha-amylase family glycosyl hydrolase [Robinsoniella sp.]|nr:alpha-amylase family glycosyl hydrolase [Robinsoniella sp.]
MKKSIFSKLMALGLASSMLIGNQAMVLASESSSASFTAKDGVIDEQPGDVFYEIFVRAFRDSDGDSIGDFKGVEEMVPYLADLGITGIWLMPITQSSSEHCYDVNNYYEVNSDYGTMEDFQSMLQTCHEYGIKVVMDLVVNHCGFKNVWFQEALKGPTLEDGSANPYWDYFTFIPSDANLVEKTAAEIHDEEVAYLEAHGSMEGYEVQYPMYDNATQGPDKTVWTDTDSLPIIIEKMISYGYMQPEAAEMAENIISGYKYLAIFGFAMPDLNFESEALREEIKDVAAYWLEAGVDGFRLDAARHIYGDYYSNIYTDYMFEKNMGFWKDFRASLEKEYPDAYLIGEVWEKNTNNVAPFVSEGGLHSIFDFNLSSKIYEAVSNESTAYDPEAAAETNRLTDGTDLNIVSDLITYYDLLGEASNYEFIDCPFSTNHDQNRMISLLRYQFDETAADILTANILTNEDGTPVLREDADKAEDHAKVAADLLLTMPGKPFMYYGEEIGMDGAKPDSSIRECMAWFEEPFDAEGNAKEGLANYNKVVYSLGGESSVEAQIDDPTSLLSHYKELIQTRKDIPALMNGDLDEYPIDSQEIVSYIRMTNEQRVLVLINLTGEALTQELSADPNYGEFTSIIFQSQNDTSSSLDGQNVTIAPYSMIILE